MSALDIVQMNREFSGEPLYVYNNNGDRFDISSEPIIDQPDLRSSMTSDKLIRTGKAYERYMFNGVSVPRVTSILAYCDGDKDSLMNWAARLGPKYKEVSNSTLDIGTKVHEAIAEYLTAGTTYCIKGLRNNIKKEVMQCLKNFMSWYNHTKDIGWDVKIFVSEVPLICPWFAGTADAILIINGKRYIVDFKSSKKISPSYFIQTAAYKWIIDNYYPEYGPIDGLGILRFDKFTNKYEDLFLEVSNPDDMNFILYCQQVFGVALNMFYSMEILNKDYNTIYTDGNHLASINKKGKKKHVQRVNGRECKDK